MNLNNPEYYVNRELSWLAFNERVLEEAQDKNNLIFERLKFLAITSSNMDEFFMVRVSGLMDQQIAEYRGKDPAGLSPGQQLTAISKKVHELVQKQYNCLNRSIIPSLAKENIYMLDYHQLDESQRTFVKDYFENTVYPVLTPMAIDQSRPFPLLANKSLNIIVELEDDEETFAVVQAPSVLSRTLELPSIKDKRRFIFLENIIKAFLPYLFRGKNVRSAYTFRITRNSDLLIDEEDSDDLLHEIERSIKKRKWGEPVRLELEKSTSTASYKFLKRMLDLGSDNIYHAAGPVDLTLFFAFTGLSGFGHLKNSTLEPRPVKEFLYKDVFDAIRENDILVHHPYESFGCVIDFIENASKDPDVLAIKQTLYRVSGNSPVINALIKAAENGKQVTVLVELKARFDEEKNIMWAKKLEKAGCHVVYGLVGLKIHCKICLVVRSEDDGIRRYVHLATGNYNDATAKLYTDLGFFTCKESFGRDTSDLFNVLTGYSVNNGFQKIWAAPLSLREMFLRNIESERKNAQNGMPAYIVAKMNSLVDVELIQALYSASMAGVKIRLIVRGICCLKTGIPRISENITVVSIIDRFLEHSRIFLFCNGGEPKIYLSSADWMPRNLDRRVEIAFPLDDVNLKKRVEEILNFSLADTVKLRVMQPDGTYEKIDRRGKESFQSQLEFYNCTH